LYSILDNPDISDSSIVLRQAGVRMPRRARGFALRDTRRDKNGRRPPMPHTADASAVLGTWRLQSYVREVLETGERYNQFGNEPDGYIGYASDNRMYAIFTRGDRITPADVVPTEEEGVQLLGTMVAYAGTFTLEPGKVTHHIDISWNQAWTGTDQVRFYKLDGDTLTITTAPYKSYLDGREGRSILVWRKVRPE
jgi:hypothetical protein